MNFSDLTTATDQATLDACGDDAVLDDRPVRILYCAPWIEPPLGSLRTSLTQPMAYLPLSRLNGAAEGSLLAYGGIEYDVVGLEPDGSGWVGLALRER